MSAMCENRLLLLDEKGDVQMALVPSKDEVIIGSDVNCDLRFVDKQLQNHHLKIYRESSGKIKIINLCDNFPVKVNGELVTSKKELCSGDSIEIFNHKMRWESKADTRRRTALLSKSEKKNKKFQKIKGRVTVHSLKHLATSNDNDTPVTIPKTPEKSVQSNYTPSSPTNLVQDKENEALNASLTSLNISGTLKTSYTPSVRNSPRVRKTPSRFESPSIKKSATPAKNVLGESSLQPMEVNTPNGVKKSMHAIEFATPHKISTPKTSRKTPRTQNLLKSALKNSTVKSNFGNESNRKAITFAESANESSASELSIVNLSSDSEVCVVSSQESNPAQVSKTALTFSEVEGVGSLLKTPTRTLKTEVLNTTNYVGVKEMMKTPSRLPKDDLTDVMGVRQLMRTPAQKPVDDLSLNVEGIAELMKTPARPPKNDLSDLSGVADLLKTPKTLSSDADTTDLMNQIEEAVGSQSVSGEVNSQDSEFDRKCEEALMDRSSMNEVAKDSKVLENSSIPPQSDNFEEKQEKILNWIENQRQSIASQENIPDQVRDSRYSDVTPDVSIDHSKTPMRYDANPKISILQTMELSSTKLSISPTTRHSLGGPSEVVENFSLNLHSNTKKSLRSTRKNFGAAIACLYGEPDMTIDANMSMDTSAVEQGNQTIKTECPEYLTLDGRQPVEIPPEDKLTSPEEVSNNYLQIAKFQNDDDVDDGEEGSGNEELFEVSESSIEEIDEDSSDSEEESSENESSENENENNGETPVFRLSSEKISDQLEEGVELLEQTKIDETSQFNDTQKDENEVNDEGDESSCSDIFATQIPAENLRKTEVLEKSEIVDDFIVESSQNDEVGEQSKVYEFITNGEKIQNADEDEGEQPREVEVFKNGQEQIEDEGIDSQFDIPETQLDEENQTVEDIDIPETQEEQTENCDENREESEHNEKEDNEETDGNYTLQGEQEHRESILFSETEFSAVELNPTLLEATDSEDSPTVSEVPLRFENRGRSLMSEEIAAKLKNNRKTMIVPDSSLSNSFVDFMEKKRTENLEGNLTISNDVTVDIAEIENSDEVEEDVQQPQEMEEAHDGNVEERVEILVTESSSQEDEVQEFAEMEVTQIQQSFAKPAKPREASMNLDFSSISKLGETMFNQKLEQDESTIGAKSSDDTLLITTSEISIQNSSIESVEIPDSPSSPSIKETTTAEDVTVGTDLSEISSIQETEAKSAENEDTSNSTEMEVKPGIEPENGDVKESEKEEEEITNQVPVEEEICVKKVAYVTTDETTEPETPSRSRNDRLNYADLGSGSSATPKKSRPLTPINPKVTTPFFFVNPQEMENEEISTIETAENVEKSEEIKIEKSDEKIEEIEAEISVEKEINVHIEIVNEPAIELEEAKNEEVADEEMQSPVKVETPKPIPKTPSTRRGGNRMDYAALASGATPKRARPTPEKSATPVSEKKPKRGKKVMEAVAIVEELDESEEQIEIQKIVKRRGKAATVEVENTTENSSQEEIEKVEEKPKRGKAKKEIEKPEAPKRGRRAKTVEEPESSEVEVSEESIEQPVKSSRRGRKADTKIDVEVAPPKRGRGKVTDAESTQESVVEVDLPKKRGRKVAEKKNEEISTTQESVDVTVEVEKPKRRVVKKKEIEKDSEDSETPIEEVEPPKRRGVKKIEAEKSEEDDKGKKRVGKSVEKKSEPEEKEKSVRSRKKKEESELEEVEISAPKSRRKPTKEQKDESENLNESFESMKSTTSTRSRRGASKVVEVAAVKPSRLQRGALKSQEIVEVEEKPARGSKKKIETEEVQPPVPVKKGRAGRLQAESVEVATPSPKRGKQKSAEIVEEPKEVRSRRGKKEATEEPEEKSESKVKPSRKRKSTTPEPEEVVEKKSRRGAAKNEVVVEEPTQKKGRGAKNQNVIEIESEPVKKSVTKKKEVEVEVTPKEVRPTRGKRQQVEEKVEEIPAKRSTRARK